ncbi:MAG: YtxH domain-containing protein [Helicobacter sp.]|nr:YtxH domain-containing protein [Helicobacter sp.]
MISDTNLQNLDSIQDNPYIQQEKANIGQAREEQANQQDKQSKNPKDVLSSFFNSGNTQQDFLKGALIGAVATFVLTNEDVQRAIFKGFAKFTSLLEMGLEELKERYEDAKAEVDSQQ